MRSHFFPEDRLNDPLLAACRLGMVIIAAFFLATTISAWHDVLKNRARTWRNWLIASLLTDATVVVCFLAYRTLVTA